MTPIKKNGIAVNFTKYKNALDVDEIKGVPNIWINMKGTKEVNPIILNATKVVFAESLGFLLSSIKPNSYFIMVSIHTFLLEVIALTISPNSSSLKPFSL